MPADPIHFRRTQVPPRAVWAALALALVVGAGAYLWLAGRPTDVVQPPTNWPTAGWRSGPPEAAGFRSDKIAEGLLAIHQEGVPIHSLTIIRHGSTVVDASFYPYDGATVHDMASVTKSVLATLIGIAVDQGKVDLDDPLVSFFPDRTIANLDDRKQRVTVEHLVSMSSGLECVEANEATQQEMMATEDWVQFALDLPVASEPGTRFVYCNPAIHLLSAILQQATGMTALEFAQVNLFEPLGIEAVEWAADPQGYNHGWGDIFLRPQDAAKLGFLWLHQGRWADRQIVSAEWVAAASQRRMGSTGRSEDYGYAWWVSAEDEEIPFVMASGAGGQYVRVFPSLDMVIVTTGGGLDWDMISPYLIAAIGDSDAPLPVNPAGEAAVDAAVRVVGQAPAASPVPALPEIASLISGATYAFEDDALIEWVRLDFAGETEASMELSVSGEGAPRTIQVGLDGIYRAAGGDAGGLARGEWVDDRTLLVEYDTLPNVEHYTLRLTFEGERVVFSLEERVYGTSATLEGAVREP